MYQTQTAPEPRGTAMRLSGRTDLRLLTLEDRAGDLATFYENSV